MEGIKLSTSHIISNHELTLKINELGAELSAITDLKTGKEYLWNADETYWKRHSPVLFPIVGSLKNKEYSYNDSLYSMSQHGFARDMVMKVLEKTENEIWFELKADDETKKSYPFDFILKIGYRLEDRKIKVMWDVTNEGNNKMYFQIGAHPAFNCPIHGEEGKHNYGIDFHTNSETEYTLLTSNGLMKRESYQLSTKDGVLKVTDGLFDQDALIFENLDTKRISLITPDNKAYVTVNFEAPVVGIWSPAGKDAPFICIEPWYGRCDADDFDGTLKEREWIYELEENESFKAGYEIVIG
jgi:galactose mutarotase-like enzyme